MKKVYIITFIFLFIALVISVVFFTSPRQSNIIEKGADVKVGAILNLTGPPAQFDAIKVKTLTVAKERIDSLYPNLNLNLKFFDAGASPEITNIAIKKAVEWGAEYILSGTSPTALAVAHQIRGKEPVIINMANAANPDFGPPRKGEYRYWPDWKQEANIILNICKKENLNKILLIYSADPYSTALFSTLQSHLQKIDGFRLFDFQYDPASTPDFRPSVLRAKNENFDAIVIFGLPPGIKSLISQLAEVKWDKTLIGGVNINLALSDITSAGLKCSVWAIKTKAMEESMLPGSEEQFYRDAFEKKYNSSAPFYALYLGDALYCIAMANDTEKSKNLTPLQKIENVHSFYGPSGPVVINDDGTLQFDMDAKKIQ